LKCTDYAATKSDKMTENLNSRLHAIVEGRVQGVGFRYFVEEEAVKLDLNGWVRNRLDGSVEVTVEGASVDLEKFLAALQKGPRASIVNHVHQEWQTHTGEFTHFYIRMTA
jgi:acylphosphatase